MLALLMVAQLLTAVPVSELNDQKRDYKLQEDAKMDAFILPEVEAPVLNYAGRFTRAASDINLGNILAGQMTNIVING